MPANYSGALSGAAQGAAVGSVIPGIGTAVGAIVGGIGGLLTGKQKAPAAATFTPVDVAAESAKAIAANNANFEAASNLSAKTNAFNQQQASSLLEKAIPGFSALQGKLLAKVNQDLDSDTSLPADVQSKIQQFAAEKGITRGTSGGFNSFSLVKDFGFSLTDYRSAQRAMALNTLSTVFNMSPRVNPMSPMASFVDPNTAIQVAGQNNRTLFDAQQANNNAQAAAGNTNALMTAGTISNIASAFSSAYGIQSKAGATVNFGDTSVGSGRSPAPASFGGK